MVNPEDAQRVLRSHSLEGCEGGESCRGDLSKSPPVFYPCAKLLKEIGALDMVHPEPPRADQGLSSVCGQATSGTASGMTRLLLLCPSRVRGGAEEIVALLAQGMAQRRIGVWVACPPNSPLMERLHSVPGVTRIPLAFPTMPSLRTLRRLRAIIRSQDIQIVHTHLWTGDLYGWLATRGLRVTLRSTLHGVNFFWEYDRGLRRLTSWWWSQVYRRLYHGFDGIAACSRAVAHAVTTRPGMPVPWHRLHTIHNGIDVDTVRRNAQVHLRPLVFSIPSAEGFGGAEMRLVVVANWTPLKGHRVLLEALPSVCAGLVCPDKYLPMRCAWIGEGLQTNQLATQIRRLGLSSVITFARPLSSMDTLAVLRDADLLVCPSSWEAFGLVILEAMALRVPVVACASGGIPEIIEHGKTGWLARPDDPVDLSRQILRALTMPRTEREQMVSQATATLEQRFTAAQMVAAYADWYEQRAVSPTTLAPQGVPHRLRQTAQVAGNTLCYHSLRWYYRLHQTVRWLPPQWSPLDALMLAQHLVRRALGWR